jgi:hypothetical protein
MDSVAVWNISTCATCRFIALMTPHVYICPFHVPNTFELFHILSQAASHTSDVNVCPMTLD